VKKIEEVSVLLFQLEVNIEQMSNDCLEFERKQAQAGNESHVEWAKEYVRLGRPVELQKKEVKKQIRLARFWLGKKLSKKFERHYGLLEEYLLLLDDRKFDEADKCWNKIEASKLSVLDFLENPDE
jgi:hypothetical protein